MEEGVLLRTLYSYAIALGLGVGVVRACLPVRQTRSHPPPQPRAQVRSKRPNGFTAVPRFVMTWGPWGLGASDTNRWGPCRRARIAAIADDSWRITVADSENPHRYWPRRHPRPRPFG